MTAFRVAMPNRVTKPTSEPSDSTPAGDEHREHSAHQRERQVGQHQQQPAPLPEGQPQEHHDTGRREEAVAQQLAASLALCGPRSADLGVHPGRQADARGQARSPASACTPSVSPPATLAVTVCTRRVPDVHDDRPPGGPRDVGHLLQLAPAVRRPRSPGAREDPPVATRPRAVTVTTSRWCGSPRRPGRPRRRGSPPRPPSSTSSGRRPDARRRPAGRSAHGDLRRDRPADRTDTSVVPGHPGHAPRRPVGPRRRGCPGRRRQTRTTSSRRGTGQRLLDPLATGSRGSRSSHPEIARSIARRSSSTVSAASPLSGTQATSNSV